MEHGPTFEKVAYLPGVHATQGTNESPCPYKPVSFAPEYESDQWIKITKKARRRNKRASKMSF